MVFILKILEYNLPCLCLQFYMVAANLRGSHATEWMELAEMCIKMKEEKLALDCFSKGRCAVV